MANRGDNTIVRIKQDGAFVAIRRVVVLHAKELEEARLNGIATSRDGKTIYATYVDENGDGGVLAMPRSEPHFGCVACAAVQQTLGHLVHSTAGHDPQSLNTTSLIKARIWRKVVVGERPLATKLRRSRSGSSAQAR